MNRIIRRIRDTGVVGAGGAGFPTHVKLDSKVNYVIANGAECEPLLYKDKELMLAYPDGVVGGLRLAMEATEASKGIVAIKEKNVDVVEKLQDALKDTEIELLLLGDFYPAGDEFVLVYEATGRLIPSGGIPPQVGVVVNNVETLLNIGMGEPVTDKLVTVTGAVKTPTTLKVPVGTSGEDLIGLAGGAVVNDYVGFYSGVMMGEVITDLSEPITKTTSGIIVLPNQHPLVIRKTLPKDRVRRRGKSACDQCTDCTELCPRYLLGYSIQPHKVMRSLGFGGERGKLWSRSALLCCECSLCSLYACPEDLDPGGICAWSKAELLAGGEKWDVNRGPLRPHPMREFRRVPIKSLVSRLGLRDYDLPAPLTDRECVSEGVRLPLKQHVGDPAVPVVKTGDFVEKGDLIAEIQGGKLGARVHASISGKVTEVKDSIVIERT